MSVLSWRASKWRCWFYRALQWAAQCCTCMELLRKGERHNHYCLSWHMGWGHSSQFRRDFSFFSLYSSPVVPWAHLWDALRPKWASKEFSRCYRSTYFCCANLHDLPSATHKLWRPFLCVRPLHGVLNWKHLQEITIRSKQVQIQDVTGFSTVPEKIMGQVLL